MGSPDLTDCERDLLDAMVSGVRLNRPGGHIRAAAIRALLAGRVPSPRIDPRGIDLENVTVEGRLDLDDVRTDLPLRLTSCHLLEGLSARHSRLRSLSLTNMRIHTGGPIPVDLLGAHLGGQLMMSGAQLANDTGPALNAESATIDQSVFLDAGFTATGAGETGAVNLLAAHLGGQLVMSGAQLTNTDGPALNADSATIDQTVALNEGFTATGAGETGAVNLLGAHLGGQLMMSGADLTNDTGPALNANGATIDQTVALNEGFTATGAGETGAVNLLGAHLGDQLMMSGADLTNDTGPALHAGNATIDQTALLDAGFTATGAGETGAVNLLGAHLGGQLMMSGAQLTNTTGPALHANGATIDQTALLDAGFTATGAGETGAVNLATAHLGGMLGMSGAQLTNTDGPALNANGATIDQTALLDAGFTATGAGETGAVNLATAHLGGMLGMSGAQLTNTTGPAFNAGLSTIDQMVLLDEEFTATGAGETGAVNLVGAHLGGMLVMSGAQLTNTTGPAFNAGLSTIDQMVLLDEECTATGAGETGAVNLVGAHLGGMLVMSGAQLTNTTGPALNAAGATIDHSLALNEGFTATGAGDDGTVRLTRARIGEELNLAGATLRNRSGPALQSRALRVGGAMIASGPDPKQTLQASGCGRWGVLRLAQARIGSGLVLTGARITHSQPRSRDEVHLGPGLNAPDLVTDGSLLLNNCVITGNGPNGTVRLTGARIGGELSLRDSEVENSWGPALSANRVHIERGLLLNGATLTNRAGLPKRATSTMATPTGDLKGTVRLIGATVRANLIIDDALINAAIDEGQRWAVDELTYSNAPTGPRDAPLSSLAWLDLLRRGTVGYSAKPYRHLAAACTAAGHDDQARTVLITQREHQITAGGLNARSRAWAQFTGITLKYGYQPWRALVCAAAITVLAAVLAIFLGGHGALVHTQRVAPAGVPGSTCSIPERIGYALDGFLPLIRTGARDTCTPALDTLTGATLQLSSWTLGLLTWAFITLFIAGFTNIIRKT